MASQAFRLPNVGGIDRDRPLGFRFAGKRYGGFAGDTLASALLANGVHLVARSFKYHRPRGILAAGREDPAALVQVGRGAATVPNVRASELELFDGLEASPQNCWPSLRFDLGAVADIAHRFLPAGFYYKTFKGGPGGWMAVEPWIRRAAGLGTAPAAPDPDRYEHAHRHCEVLVIGGGLAGLEAALEAARTGARVILADASPALGGRVPGEAAGRWVIDGIDARDWVARAAAELRASPDVTLLTRTLAFGYYDANWIGLLETVQDHLPPKARDARLPRQRLWRVRADAVVLATGAIERPLVFHGNDRPGVMLAGAVRAFLHRWGVLAGRRAVVFTNNDDGWTTAFDLADAGAEVAAVVDVRGAPDERLLAHAGARGLPVRAGAAVVATTGTLRLKSVTLADLDGAGGVCAERRTLACDLLAVSGGWQPDVALFAQARGKLAYDETLAAFRPHASFQRERSVGAAAGVFDPREVLGTGHRVETAAPAVPYGVTPAWLLPSGLPAAATRAFVDLQDDVTAKDLQLAVQEGYASVELAKRYTTLGMGTDQGKTSGTNGFAIIAAALGKPIGAVGTTTFRPPVAPIAFGAVAGPQTGALFRARRTTPMHAAQVEAAAVFEPVGDWIRARAYPKPGERFAAAVQREALATRTACGMLDASTLGKIDVRGKDARTFLDRVYVNAWLKLAPGRCRYGLMLNEDGMVVDDGVTACLADDHFHMTTTTGGAAHVLLTLEDYRQTEWPNLDVYLTSVTEQWAVVALAGPTAAALAAEVFDDLDPDDAVFAPMSWQAGHIQGVPVRVFRVSFTGEPTYEINIPARYGLWLWRLLLERGEAHGLTPYGTETMHLLRAEKGFIIVGQDTDGTVTPVDLGMGRMVKDRDFIGRRSLFRSDTARSDRRQLVGLLTEDPAAVLAEGAQVIATPAEQAPRTPMLGHVTSSYFSPNLGRSIAMALIAGGHGRMGETVYVARRGAAPLPAVIGGTDFLALKEART